MKRYKFLLLFVAVALVFTGCSGGVVIETGGTGDIRGIVRFRDTNQPVLDAFIQIHNRSDRTTTGGFFSISNLPSGSHDITIYHHGIKGGSHTQRVTIPANDTLILDILVEPYQGQVNTGGVAGWVYVPKDSQAGGTFSASQLENIEPVFLSQSYAPPGYEPLVGARVEIYPAGKWTETRPDGGFYLTGINPGSYDLTITHSSLRYSITKKDITIFPRYTKWMEDKDLVGGVGYYIVIGNDLDPENPYGKGLIGPRKDAIEVYNTLVKGNDLAGLGRLLIRNGGGGVQSPTLYNIENAIADAIQQSNSSEDYLVIYFSGYSARNMLYTSDNRWITDGQLMNLVEGFLGHVTLILDINESDSMADGDVLTQAFNQHNYTVLGGTLRNQDAGAHKTSDHSWFTHYLLEGIRTKKADYSNPKDGQITANELYLYVGYTTKAEGGVQTPFFSSGGYPHTVVYRY